MEPETVDRPARGDVLPRRLRTRVLPPLAAALFVGASVTVLVNLSDRGVPGATGPSLVGTDRLDRAPALGAVSPGERWRALETADGSSAGNRHETSAVALNGRIYVIGGRGRRDAHVFDAASRTWRALPDLPMELHHFQPVALGTNIYAIGAMTCCFPQEPGVATIHVLDTVTERWSTAGEVPTERVRGGAGAVVHGNWIYVVGGNTLGHSGGAVPWLDRYDPIERRWERLPDAPTARDHFQAALVDGRIVVAGGRQSAMPVPQRNTVTATDVYDIAGGRWSSGTPLPTGRGGTVSVAHDGTAIVLGGEIANAGPALDTVEAYDLASDSWRTLSPLIQGRHGSGAAVIGETLHIVAGSLHRGGAPETDSHETLALDGDAEPDPDRDGDGLDDADETALHGTDPDDPDSDDDGLRDGREIALGTDPLSRDGDADGLLDGAEVDTHGTDPARADSDDDGLADGAEVETHGTDPTRADSDGDGLSDGAEVETHGTDPNRADSDGDGLPDGAEVETHGTDPNRVDSDGDGLADGAEVRTHGTDPTHADSDGDGLADGAEVETHGTDPTRADSDGDGLGDGAEIDVHGTDPNRVDTDGDGLADGVEVDAHGTDPRLADTDADGMDDGEEIERGRDPSVADTEPDQNPDPAPTPVTEPGPTPDPTPEPGTVDDGEPDPVTPLPTRKSGGGAASWGLVLLGLVRLLRRRPGNRGPRIR